MTAPTVDTPLTTDERREIMAQQSGLNGNLAHRYEATLVALESRLLAARREVEALRQSLRADALCVSQWFDDSWVGEPDEPVYEAAQRIWAALAATPEEK